MFVGRNEDDSIYGLWTVRQWAGQEELPDDHEEVVEFLNWEPPERTPAQKLAAVGLSVEELKTLLGVE